MGDPSCDPCSDVIVSWERQSLQIVLQWQHKIIHCRIFTVAGRRVNDACRQTQLRKVYFHENHNPHSQFVNYFQ